MGSPSFLKFLIAVSLVVGAVWAGMNYIRENPDTVDIQKIQQEPAKPPRPPARLGY